MSEPAKKKAVYEDLSAVPEGMTGEIINGELIVAPRPSRKHILASSFLGGELIPPYCHGRGGEPGGWVILVEPEIGLGEHTIVPDLAGWKVERYPEEEPHNWISASPDWVCEIISPGTETLDRDEKMSIYEQHQVPYIWLINPIIMTLKAYRLSSEGWFRFAMFSGNKKTESNPFARRRLTWGFFGVHENLKSPGIHPVVLKEGIL